MADTLPSTSELCPLTTRLLPKELAHAFGIAHDAYDSPCQNAEAAGAAAATISTQHKNYVIVSQPKADAPPQQQKRKATEQQAPAVVPSPAVSAPSSLPQPAESLNQSLVGASAQTASLQTSSAMPGQPASQQQATSSISAGYQQPPALQATAAVVQAPFRGFPAAYLSPHPLLNYGQQAVAAIPSLSGSLGVSPVAMYSAADYTAVMAMQQQQKQQQQQQQHQQQLDEAAEEHQARALKRPRLVWTPQLHKLFEEAVQKIGINKAVPKTIMQLMNVEGLTRENVASHLQKYRLSLKKGPDGEFITTVTEGTEVSLPDLAAGGDGTAAAAAAAGNTSSNAAGGSAGCGTGGVSSDAATNKGAVAGSGGEGADVGSGATGGGREQQEGGEGAAGAAEGPTGAVAAAAGTSGTVAAATAAGDPATPQDLQLAAVQEELP